jgi:hypothetical protein
VKKLWIVHTEIIVEPGDLPSGNTKMFCNVITWADSPTEVEPKIREYIETFRWKLIGADKVDAVQKDFDYGDDINEMISRAEVNPNAIILGPFHSYRATDS